MKKVLGTTLLCSVLFLGACQSKVLNEDMKQKSTVEKSSKKLINKTVKSSNKTESVLSAEPVSETSTEMIQSESMVQGNESSISKEKIQQLEGMNLLEIQNNNYNSVVGTWQNAEGQTFVFNADGIVGDNTYVNKFNTAIIEHNILKTSVSEGNFGYVIEFLPAGCSEVNDASDSSKDRIWAGQQADFSNASAFFYKIN